MKGEVDFAVGLDQYGRTLLFIQVRKTSAAEPPRRQDPRPLSVGDGGDNTGMLRLQ